MSKKEALTAIAALNNSLLAGLNDQEFTSYLEGLDKFCSNLPPYEEAANNLIKTEDYVALIKILGDILALLSRIHAQGLIDLCGKINDNFNEIIKSDRAINREELETELSELMRGLSVLSIDIQMALHKEGDAQSPGAQKDSYKILAVDDSSFFLNLLKMHLTNTQYHITCVNSGALALRYLQTNQPDLLLLDIDMPEMDGFELAKTIRDRGVKEPILFLTSYANKSAVMKAIRSGGTDFIVKPCSKEQLTDYLLKHLGG